jgi:polyribonucleotide nucleotidyltransferase
VEITKIDDRGKLSLSPVVADEAGSGNSENPDNAEVSLESAE